MASVGELFVSLGVKGSEKTLGALGATKQGLTDLKTTSFEAKAALVGAFYALQQLFSASGQAGTNLTNFNALLGGGFVQTLQRYQYAARQVGVSNEEVAGTFKSLQSAMAKTLMGGGAPAGLARVARVTHTAIGSAQIKEFADHPEKLLQLLQNYAQLEKDAALRNETLGSFGLGDGMKSAVARNAFRPEVLAKAPTYSDNEVGALDKANIAWANLSNTIQMAIGHLNAAHGGQLVKDITSLVGPVLKLSEAFLHLAEKMQLFKGIDMAFKGWVEIFKLLEELIDKIIPSLPALSKVLDLVAGTVTETFNDPTKVGKSAEELGEGAKDVLKGMFITLFGDDGAAPAAPGAKPVNGVAPTARPPVVKLVPGPNALPAPPPVSATQQKSAQNVEINQNLNFSHPGTNAQQTADSSAKSVRHAWNSLFSQSGGQ